MSTESLELAIASTRGVLAAVTPDQMSQATPCASWKVSDLINHIVGGLTFFEVGVTGAAPAGGEVDFSAGDYLADFDAAAARTVAAFSAEGVMAKMLTLPFGEMPGAAFLGLATMDCFTHGWDLAAATGQSTDLAPALAEKLLVQAQTAISPALRSEEGSVFGFEKPAPAGATAADALAAYLGRTA